ncbi:MAG: DUF2062 domain-containing protein [Pseudomonadota bacterium]|nr:DUF2062 domain-containing protein [Pseudomonadota bacterium]
MPRRVIKRYMPDHQWVREHKHLQHFGELLHDPNLWHLNRRSVAGAAGLGIFVAFIPVPMQMVLAAAGAILLRVNLPLAVAGVWITNPVTMPPIYYFTYKVGTWLLRAPPRPFEFELSLNWLWHEAGAVLWPLLVGSLSVGLVAGCLAYAAVRLLWRLHVVLRRRRSGRARK